MDKKAEFDFRTYLIGITLVMGILVTFAMSYMSMAQQYGLSTTSASQFNATYNKLDSIATFTDTANSQIQGSTLNDESAAENTQFWGSMLSLSKRIYGLITLPQALIGDMFNTIPIAPIWKDIAIYIIVILFVTAFIFLVFQNRG